MSKFSLASAIGQRILAARILSRSDILSGASWALTLKPVAARR